MQKLLIIFLAILMVACQKQSDDSNKKELEYKTLLSPNSSLSFGRQSAMYRHFSQWWQISEIDDIPTEQVVFMDLTHLSNDKAYVVFDGCNTIDITFDTSQIDKNRLYVHNIKRELKPCSSSYEDQLMAILADTQGIEYDNTTPDRLKLLSYQHSLTLTLNK